MKVLVVGGIPEVDELIVDFLLRKGHKPALFTTDIAHIPKHWSNNIVRVIAGNPSETSKLEKLFESYNCVINTVRDTCFKKSGECLAALSGIHDAIISKKVPRYIALAPHDFSVDPIEPKKKSWFSCRAPTHETSEFSKACSLFIGNKTLEWCLIRHRGLSPAAAFSELSPGVRRTGKFSLSSSSNASPVSIAHLAAFMAEMATEPKVEFLRASPAIETVSDAVADVERSGVLQGARLVQLTPSTASSIKSQPTQQQQGKASTTTAAAAQEGAR